MNFICDPELKLTVHQLRTSDFQGEFDDMICMLRHTAANPKDLGSGIVGRTLVFDTGRIHDMAEHLQTSEVGSDFITLSKMLRRNQIDIIEMIDDIGHPLKTKLP